MSYNFSDFVFDVKCVFKLNCPEYQSDKDAYAAAWEKWTARRLKVINRLWGVALVALIVVGTVSGQIDGVIPDNCDSGYRTSWGC